MVPSGALALAGGLRCSPREVPLAVWQAHLVKHPLGLDALRSGRPWNNEGWDTTTPPAVTAEARVRLVERIQALEDGSRRCGVREFRGGHTPAAPEDPCYRCASPLQPRCAAILDEPEGVGRRYAAVTAALLGEFAEQCAIEVPRLALSYRLTAGLRHPSWIEAGLILAAGVEGRKPAAMVRIARGDGTRADFWLNGRELRWRTTYRIPQRTVHTRFSFLMDLPAKTPSLPLSDVYVVPRGWWEAHGP